MFNNISKKIRNEYVDNKKLSIDIILLVLAIITTIILLISFDIAETFYHFSREHEEYDLDEIVLALAISSFYLVLFLLRRFYELKEFIIKANTDPLIGIFNRRKGSDLITKELVYIKNHRKTTSSIIMFDIDDFKQINDSYGHDRGDYILKELIRILVKEQREKDITIRWGGEEFIILCPNSNVDAAYKLAERYRKKVYDYAFKENIKVTLSFGVTQLHIDQQLRDQIIRVDKLLYASKENGKNQITKSR